MTLQEQYSRILEKEQENNVIPFLQSLTPAERTQLSPHIKTLGKQYFEYVQMSNRWSTRATNKQRTILYYSFFACYSFREIQKENPAWLLSREHLEKFLSWYCPPWLSDYINGFSETGWVPYELNYRYLLELTARGFVQPVPMLVARQLISFLHEQKGRERFYQPENLLQHEVTMKEHIWYLFHLETTVHSSNRYHTLVNGQQQKGWMEFFLEYSAMGKIDRSRLLHEALLASNRNFNKALSGWFADLFLLLKPTEEEIMVLQQELFPLFSSAHGKTVSTALHTCKIILNNPGFDTESFLGSAALLLSTATKSVVASSLQMLEKLLKKDRSLQARISLLAAGALIHKEESLQTRAAKLISKWGDPADKALQDALSLYNHFLFSVPASLLQPFFSNSGPQLTNPADTAYVFEGQLDPAKCLPAMENMDDLVFLASQAFDNNESWHLDVLPAALIRMQPQIRGEHIRHFEPALQRALKLYFGDWRSNQGQLDILLAGFFLDYMLWLIRQYPVEGQAATGLYGSYMSKNEENRKIWDEHGTAVSFFLSWKPEGNRYLFSAHHALLGHVLDQIKEGRNFPVLSEPTHTPAWIDPAVLVERLSVYEQHGQSPSGMDLQIAVSRCWLHHTGEAIQLATRKLKGELLQLMLFLLNDAQDPQGPFTLEAAWMVAALSKTPQKIYPELADLYYSQLPRERYTGSYPYQIRSEDYLSDHYNWVNGRTIIEKILKRREVVHLDVSAQKDPLPAITGIKKLLSRFSRKKEPVQPDPGPLLYDFLRKKGNWFSTEDRDVRRLYMLMLNNPEPLLAFTVKECLWNPELSSEVANRFVVRVLEVLQETWHSPGEMAHLLTALCLVSADKTVVSYATEIWFRGSAEGNMDIRLLGDILGRLQSIELAPLKRFTDLVMKSLLGISPAQNEALEILLTGMLIRMPDKPVRGHKKLLEIYFETVRLNKTVIKNSPLHTKLQVWMENSSLHKMIRANL